MIQISESEGLTSVRVDGIEMGCYASKFRLAQDGHNVPILILEIPAMHGVEVEIPDGVVIAKSFQAIRQPPE